MPLVLCRECATLCSHHVTVADFSELRGGMNASVLAEGEVGGRRGSPRHHAAIVSDSHSADRYHRGVRNRSAIPRLSKSSCPVGGWPCIDQSSAALERGVLPSRVVERGVARENGLPALGPTN